MDDLEQEGLTISTTNMNVASQNTSISSLSTDSDFIEGLKEIVNEPIETKIAELPAEFMSTLDKLMDQIKLISSQKSSQKTDDSGKNDLIHKFDKTAGKSKPTEEDLKKLPAVHSLGFLYLGEYCKKLIKSKQDSSGKLNPTENLGKIFKDQKKEQPKKNNKKEDNKEQNNFFKSMKGILDRINPANWGKMLKAKIPFLNKVEKPRVTTAGVLIYTGDVGADANAMKSMMKALKYIEKIKAPSMKEYNKARDSMRQIVKDMKKLDKDADTKSALSFGKKFKEIGVNLIQSLGNIFIISTLATPASDALKKIGSIKGKRKTGMIGYLLDFTKSIESIDKEIKPAKIKSSTKSIQEVTSNFKMIAGNLALIGLLAIPAFVSLRMMAQMDFIGEISNFLHGLEPLTKIKLSAANIKNTSATVHASIGLFANITAAAILAIPAGIFGTIAYKTLSGSEKFLNALRPVVKAASKIPDMKKTMQLGLLVPFFGIITVAAILAVPAGIMGLIGMVAMFGIKLFINEIATVAKIAEKNRKRFYSLTISALAILGAISLLALTMFIMNTTLSVKSILMGCISLVMLGVFIGLTAVVGMLAKHCIKLILYTTLAAALLAVTALALFVATTLLNKTQANLVHSIIVLGVSILLLALVAVAGYGAMYALTFIAAFTLACVLLAVTAGTLYLTVTLLSKINPKDLMIASGNLALTAVLMLAAVAAGVPAIAAAPGAVALGIACSSLALAAVTLPVIIKHFSKIKLEDIIHASKGLAEVTLLMLAASAAGIASVPAVPGIVAMTLACVELTALIIPLQLSLVLLNKVSWQNIPTIIAGMGQFSLLVIAAGAAGVASLVALPGIASLGVVALAFSPVALSLGKCLKDLQAIDWGDLSGLSKNVAKLPGIFKSTKKAAKEIDSIKLKPSKAKDLALSFENVSTALKSLNDVLTNELNISEEGLKINDNFIQPLANLKEPADNINNLAKGFKNLNAELKKFAKDSKDSVKILKDLAKFNSSGNSSFDINAQIRDVNAQPRVAQPAYAMNNNNISAKDMKDLLTKLDEIKVLLEDQPESWAKAKR